MILLRNTQNVLKCSTREVKLQIQLLLSAAKHGDWDIGVCLTTDKVLRALNAEYRNKFRSTDILSFPFVEAVKPGVLPKPRSDDDKNLGDIYISMKYVKGWCKENNVDIKERLPVLYAHGICHLLGYDHQNDKDYEQMRKKEELLLKKMKKWKAQLGE